MLRFAIIVCLCAALLVKGQGGPGDMPPLTDGVPPFPDNIPPPSRLAVHNRVARQAMPVPGQMPGMPAMGDNPGNLGMQGLGNIPDPTVVIAKFQEVGRQFLNGRRRRHV